MDEDYLAERIGRFLRDCRVASGMTQQDLADRLGKSRTTVTHIEKGTRMPGGDVLVKMFEVFGCTVTSREGCSLDFAEISPETHTHGAPDSAPHSAPVAEADEPARSYRHTVAGVEIEISDEDVRNARPERRNMPPEDMVHMDRDGRKYIDVCGEKSYIQEYVVPQRFAGGGLRLEDCVRLKLDGDVPVLLIDMDVMHVENNAVCWRGDFTPQEKLYIVDYVIGLLTMILDKVAATVEVTDRFGRDTDTLEINQERREFLERAFGLPLWVRVREELENEGIHQEAQG